jgi:hypothetical protein
METFHGKARAQWWEAVSTNDPAERVADRPKMAEALASLKEGLAENDDPFYDGWKLRNASGAAPDNLAATRDAAQPEHDATDTVPVRVVRYPVFPRWAIILAVALVAFAAVVTAVRLASRAGAPHTMSSAPAPEPRATRNELPVQPPEAPTSGPVSTASAASPSPRKWKGKKPKTQDPGFFRDPGF